ncbi:MAG: hypothetical protein ACYTEQ_24680 [Planctomycetota bacterium]|jgi:hypothetical protein
MAGTFLPQTGQYLDPLGLALGQGLAGVGNFLAERRDQQMWNEWLQRGQQVYQPTLGPNELMSPALRNFGPNALNQSPYQAAGPMPMSLTSPYQQLGMNLMGRQALNQLPLGPLDAAQADYLRARTQERTQEALRPPPMAGQTERIGPNDQRGFREGSVIQTDRYGNTRILYEPPSELDKTRLEQMRESTEYTRQQIQEIKDERGARLSPKERRNMAAIDAKIKRQELLLKQHDVAISPQKREKLAKEIEALDAQIRRPTKTEFERHLALLGNPSEVAKLNKEQQKALFVKMGLTAAPSASERMTRSEEIKYWQAVLRGSQKAGALGAMLDEEVKGMEGLAALARENLTRLIRPGGDLNDEELWDIYNEVVGTP